MEVWAVSSPEAEAVQGAVCVEEQQGCQDATLAYFRELLLGDCGACTMPESVAYQSMHEELAELIKGLEEEEERWVPVEGGEEEEMVVEMVMRCGKAIVGGEYEEVEAVVRRMREYGDPWGNASQRLAHYVVEALVAKMAGRGGDLYRARRRNAPSSTDILKAYETFMARVPRISQAHAFGNKSILDASAGADAVHVVDYGILHGLQWPTLMQALVSRGEGPPRLLRITGIDFPQPGPAGDARVRETGRRLVQFAASLGLRLEYRGVAGAWESVTPEVQPGEVLVVNCMLRLRHLHESGRRAVLERIRGMRPRVFVTGVMSCAANVASYVGRVRATVARHACIFDYFEATMGRECPHRFFTEAHVLGRDILNLLACDGLERVERPEHYTHWECNIVRAGFRQLPLQHVMFNRIREMQRGFHPHFTIGRRCDWLLLGWKQRAPSIFALATWEPEETL